MYNSDPGVVEMAEGLVVLSEINTVNNLQLSQMSNAIYLRRSSVGVENVLIRDCEFGIVSYQVNDVSISNCFIANNFSTDAAAVYSYTVQGHNIDHCLFYDNHISLKNEITTGSLITNNAFLQGNIGFQNLWESSAIFKYNLIKSNGTGLENSGMSNLEIDYNDINAKVCVKTFHSNNWYNTVTAGWTKAANNNLQAS